MPDKCGNFMKLTVEGLTLNLGHQHSKVRKVTLAGLKDVVTARNAEIFLTDSIKHLRMTMNDKSTDVRTRFYEVVQHWMTKMEIKSLISFESHFVLFLLNGASDENETIAQSCISFLEDHGRRMRDALKQLGDEEKGSGSDVEMKS